MRLIRDDQWKDWENRSLFSNCLANQNAAGGGERGLLILLLIATYVDERMDASWTTLALVPSPSAVCRLPLNYNESDLRIGGDWGLFEFEFLSGGRERSIACKYPFMWCYWRDSWGGRRGDKSWLLIVVGSCTINKSIYSWKLLLARPVGVGKSGGNIKRILIIIFKIIELSYQSSIWTDIHSHLTSINVRTNFYCCHLCWSVWIPLDPSCCKHEHGRWDCWVWIWQRIRSSLEELLRFDRVFGKRLQSFIVGYRWIWEVIWRGSVGELHR